MRWTSQRPLNALYSLADQWLLDVSQRFTTRAEQNNGFNVWHDVLGILCYGCHSLSVVARACRYMSFSSVRQDLHLAKDGP